MVSPSRSSGDPAINPHTCTVSPLLHSLGSNALAPLPSGGGRLLPPPVSMSSLGGAGVRVRRGRNPSLLSGCLQTQGPGSQAFPRLVGVCGSTSTAYQRWSCRRIPPPYRDSVAATLSCRLLLPERSGPPPDTRESPKSRPRSSGLSSIRRSLKLRSHLLTASQQPGGSPSPAGSHCPQLLPAGVHSRSGLVLTSLFGSLQNRGPGSTAFSHLVGARASTDFDFERRSSQRVP